MLIINLSSYNLQYSPYDTHPIIIIKRLRKLQSRPSNYFTENQFGTEKKQQQQYLTLKLTFCFSSPDWFELSKTTFEFAVTEIAWKTIEALQNIGWLNSYGKLIICFWTSIEKKTHLTTAFIEHPQLIIWSKNNSIPILKFPLTYGF